MVEIGDKKQIKFVDKQMEQPPQHPLLMLSGPTMFLILILTGSYGFGWTCVTI